MSLEGSDEFYDVQSLNSIYMQLSIHDNDNFDEKDENEFVVNKIAEIYNKEFLLIESKVLENDVNQINSSFVKLLMECKKCNFLKAGIIFINYCDYFNVEYIKIYNHFHPNIKKIITNSYINLVGDKEYQKKKSTVDSNSDYKQATIFELFVTKMTDTKTVEDDDEYFTDDEIEYQKSMEDDDEYFTDDEIEYQKTVEKFKK